MNLKVWKLPPLCRHAHSFQTLAWNSASLPPLFLLSSCSTSLSILHFEISSSCSETQDTLKRCFASASCKLFSLVIPILHDSEHTKLMTSRLLFYSCLNFVFISFPASHQVVAKKMPFELSFCGYFKFIWWIVQIRYFAQPGRFSPWVLLSQWLNSQSLSYWGLKHFGKDFGTNHDLVTNAAFSPNNLACIIVGKADSEALKSDSSQSKVSPNTIKNKVPMAHLSTEVTAITCSFKSYTLTKSTLFLGNNTIQTHISTGCLCWTNCALHIPEMKRNLKWNSQHKQIDSIWIITPWVLYCSTGIHLCKFYYLKRPELQRNASLRIPQKSIVFIIKNILRCFEREIKLLVNFSALVTTVTIKQFQAAATAIKSLTLPLAQSELHSVQNIIEELLLADEILLVEILGLFAHLLLHAYLFVWLPQ